LRRGCGIFDVRCPNVPKLEKPIEKRNEITDAKANFIKGVSYICLISSLVQLFLGLVAARASSKTEDCGVGIEEDSDTVPYLLAPCHFPSCRTLKPVLNKGEREQRILGLMSNQLTRDEGVKVFKARLREGFGDLSI
jgi:hypothetical protein